MGRDNVHALAVIDIDLALAVASPPYREGPGLKWTSQVSAQDFAPEEVQCSKGCTMENPTMLCRRQATLGPGIPVVPELVTTMAGGAAIPRFNKGLPGEIT